MMWGGCCGNWGGWGSWGWIGLLINLALILIVGGGLITLTLWAVRRFFFSGNGWGRGPIVPGVSPEDPRVILKARYARGEITREQYLEMLRDLEEREVKP